MKTKNNHKLKIFFSLIATLAITILFTTSNVVRAIEGYAFAVSPMLEKILLNPGDHYSSSVRVHNPTDYTSDMEYKISVAGYYVDDNFENIFEECDNTYCEMANWITINSPTEGHLSPGEGTIVDYTIDVPEDAPGGGQYASIIFTAEPWDEEGNDGNMSENKNDVGSALEEEKRIAYVIYAEVAGDITRQGEIIDINMPNFLLSGNIKGTASIKNTGNVHGEATYKLQVFPLFSSEEVYTNEEDPATVTILPDRTRYEETAWEGTPTVGIFNVVYTAEFEGTTAQVSKLVIVCPIWLLFLIIFIIAAIIIWLVMKIRGRKSSKKSTVEQ